MAEPKNPCAPCGEGSFQSRREFIQKAVVVGAGLTLAAASLTASTEAQASTFSHEACMQAAEDAYQSCVARSFTNNPGNGVAARARRFAAKAACEMEFDAAVVACDLRLAEAVAAELAQHIIDHPHETIPDILVIAGFIIIVIAGAPVGA